MTNITSFALICIVMLATTLSIGFVAFTNTALLQEVKISFNGQSFTQSVTQAFRIMGDPINDPRPNARKH